MKVNKKTSKILGLGCILSLTLGGLIVAAANNKTVSGNVALHAATDIETSTGVTMNTNDSAYFTAISNVQTKVIVFEVKTDGSITKFQLKGTSGSGGIIMTKPDRSVNTADEVAYENQGGSPYWGSDCYSVDIGDGWYRWVVDLTNYKNIDTCSDLNRLKCLEGNNVQVRNLRFYDEMYIESTNLCSNSYGYLESPLPNYASQTVQFDMKLTDSTQRRIQICKDSGGGLTGLIVCSKTELKVENPAGSPYLIAASTTPVSLGNDWYRFVLDLSEVKRPDNRTGTETAVKIKNLPDNNDGNPSIEMRNFKIYEPEYNPADDADITLKSGQRTTLPDIPSWSLATISFDVYHDSLDLNCDPQFIFYQKDSDSYATSFFGYKDIGGETALYLRNASDGDYWVKSTNQPVELENGWYRWTIDLSELRPEGSTGFETIGTINNRGAKDVYIKNFQVSAYDVTKDADFTWGKNNNEMYDSSGNRVTIDDWKVVDSTLTFKVFNFDSVFPNSTGSSISFASEKKGETAEITGDNRISDKIYSDGKGHLVSTKDVSKVAGTYEALTGTDKGWTLVTINCNDVLRYNQGDENLALRYIRLGGSATVYVKDLSVTSQEEKPYDYKVLEKGYIDLEEGIDNWSNKALTFKTFGSRIPTIALTDDSKQLSKLFTAKGNYVCENSNDAILGTYTELTGVEEGWYQWTVNLNSIQKETGADGSETATHLLVNSTGKFSSTFYKDLAITDISQVKAQVFAQGANVYVTNYDGVDYENGGVLRILGFGSPADCSNYGVTIEYNGMQASIDENVNPYSRVEVVTNGTSEFISAESKGADVIFGVEIFNIPKAQYELTIYSWFYYEDLLIISDGKQITVTVDDNGTHVSPEE